MTAPETTMSEYIKGFDAGYDYALLEVKRWIKQHGHDPSAIQPVEALLAHLCMETKDIGKVPIK